MAFFKKKATSVQEPMDLDAVMKKYDRESNTRIWEGVPKVFVTCVLALFSLFCLYVTLFATWLDEIRLTTFMAYIMFIGYLVFPAKKGMQHVNYIPWYDIVLMVVGTGAFMYYAIRATEIVSRFSILPYEVVIGILGIACLAELCRRCVGLPILIVAGVLLVYALIWGSTNPNVIARITEYVRVLFYSKEGILSTPVNVCSKYIVVFIIFGAFLERTGIADFFIQIANALVGRFSGGPAKVAVVASAMEGMVSGSSVANTVGSGAVTIPLMKKTGYKPEFAAAAEAAASTGGQIMPPIMGAAAFLMAETIGAYFDIMYARADVDKHQRITTLGGGLLPTARNVQYLTLIADFEYQFTPKWNAFIKGAYETSDIFKDSELYRKGHYLTTWNAQACVEWFPLTKEKGLKIYLHYLYKGNILGSNAAAMNASLPDMQRVSLGLTYSIPVL